MENPFEGKSVLVLVLDHAVADAVKKVCAGYRIETRERFEYSEPVDLVLIDPFFLDSWMSDFVKKNRSSTPFVLVTRQEELASGTPEAGMDIQDTILLPSDAAGMQRCIADWFASAEAGYLFKKPALEFGSGLWVSLALQSGESLTSRGLEYVS